MSVRQLVEVEQHLLAGQRRLLGGGVLGRLRRRPVVGSGDRNAAGRAVLLALVGTRVVPVVADPGRHREIGLEGACLDLIEDRLPQVGQVRGALLGPGVLGLEVGDHLGVVLVAQPLVVVGPGAAQDALVGRDTGGDGRLHGVDSSQRCRRAPRWRLSDAGRGRRCGNCVPDPVPCLRSRSAP